MKIMNVFTDCSNINFSTNILHHVTAILCVSLVSVLITIHVVPKNVVNSITHFNIERWCNVRTLFIEAFSALTQGFSKQLFTFIMSVHPSVCVEKLSFHWKAFCEILCWGLLLKPALKAQVSLQLVKISGTSYEV
jgi:hypothetical protein